MAFPGTAGPRLSRAECTGFMVSFAVALPAPELVLPLNDEALHSRLGRHAHCESVVLFPPFLSCEERKGRLWQAWSSSAVCVRNVEVEKEGKAKHRNLVFNSNLYPVFSEELFAFSLCVAPDSVGPQNLL